MKQIASMFYNYQEERIRAGWRIVLHLLMVQFIAQIIIIPFAANDALTNMIFGRVVLTLALFGVTLLFAIKLDKRKFIDFGFKLNYNWAKDFLFGFILGGILMLLIFLFQLWTNQLTIEKINFSLASLWPLAIGFGLFILVGFGEELFSRGYHLINLTEGFYYPSLGVKIALYFAVILSSSFFGLAHIFNSGATWISTLTITLAGIFLAVGMVFTKQLGISIGLHISWNFFQGNVFGFAVSGTTVNFSLINIRTTGNELFTGGAFGPEAGLVGVFAMLLGIAAIIIYVKIKYKRLDMNIWMENVTNRINKPVEPEHNSGIMS